MIRAAVVVACIAGCSLGGNRPNYQYYVLTPTTASARSPLTAPDERHPAVSVDRVTLPGYLDREQIVTRTRDHRLTYSRTDRWAEPLDLAFERTLRQDLAVHLSPAGILVPPRTEGPSYYLDVEVLRFERSTGDRVELWARWSVRANSDVLDSGETHLFVPMQGIDNNAMAVAASEAIARMATELAAHVRTTDTTVATRKN